MFYCLQCSIDCLEFSREHPHPQYRHLVLKSGTTAGQHDIWSDSGSGWCFVRCTPHPHYPPIPLQCPQVEEFGGQEWYELGFHWPELMFYSLQCSIDHLEFSRVLCNRPSWFFRCHPLIPPDTPYGPHWPHPHPHPQYRHLVLKSGTTAHQHDIWSACGSGWCLVRCTPSPLHPLCPLDAPR